MARGPGTNGAPRAPDASPTRPVTPMTLRPRPWANTYWVHEHALLAGEYPGDLDPQEAARRLDLLLEHGVRTLIDLTRADDALLPYAHLLRDIAAPRGVAVAHHPMPIEDMGIPTADEMRAILDRIDASLADGAVYVHCWGGVGRTGTVVGCWLVRRGRDGETALAEVDALFGTTAKRPWHPRSPQTRAQCDFVRRWREPA